MQNSSGSDTRVLLPGSDRRTPGRNAVVSWISPSLVVPDRLGCVLDQVEEHLDELVAIGEHRRQRRIVILDEADVPREARLGEPPHVIEHHVDVDGLALDRAFVAEHLHAVDQLDDAIGLVADQPRQRAIVVVDGLLEQLRRAADARQRILDLVGEHGGERDHRARRAAMGQLAIHLVGDGALLQHDDDVTGPLRHRRDMQVDHPLAGIARRAEIDLVLVDRRRRAGEPARSAPAADCRTERGRAGSAGAASSPKYRRNPRPPRWRRRSWRRGRSRRRRAATS